MSFFRRGLSKVTFCLTIADTSLPKIATEINVGKDLTPYINAMTGFTLSNAPISVPDLAHAFTSQIDGEDTVAASTITFNDDDTTAFKAIRTAMAKGTVGFIVLGPYGNVLAKRSEVWPVKVTGFNDQWDVGNNPAATVCDFAVTGVPTQTGAFAA